LKGQLLIALYSVRSDRAFCEQLDYNLLFRWFLDMALDECRARSVELLASARAVWRAAMWGAGFSSR